MISILLPAGSELPLPSGAAKGRAGGGNVYELDSFLASQWWEQRVAQAHLPPSLLLS